MEISNLTLKSSSQVGWQIGATVRIGGRAYLQPPAVNARRSSPGAAADSPTATTTIPSILPPFGTTTNAGA